MAHPELDPDLRQRLAAAVARKAWELNELLVKLLAAQKADLATLEQARARQRKIDRLRRYFDDVVVAQKRSRTDAFGLCAECGAALPLAVLMEQPWRLRCATCDERVRRESGADADADADED